MPPRSLVWFVALAAVVALPRGPLAQTWNSAGLVGGAAPPPSGPAPARDLSGIWDAGPAGISGPGHTGSPFTPLGQKLANSNKPGNGPRMADLSEINDPLSTKCDPGGFPRNLLFELRPFQIVQTATQVLMLYMFEKRWRVIWTDGRALPANPDPRWYGYSVGRWENDTTFVVQSNGLDERTWLDNAGNPHSDELRVEERYQRVSRDVIELTVTVDDPKTYTKPWLGRNKLPLRLMPASTDLMEMICSATEAEAYQKVVAASSK